MKIGFGKKGGFQYSKARLRKSKQNHTSSIRKGERRQGKNELCCRKKKLMCLHTSRGEKSGVRASHGKRWGR